MRWAPALPPDYDTWTFDDGFAAARTDVAQAVREAVASAGTLYAWARGRPDAEVFHGRGEVYAVRLGPADAVVRHARRGGVPARFSEDWFLGSPRFLHELLMARALADAGIATPPVLAGVAYRAGPGYRADVATARAPGRDLATIAFGPAAPAGASRTALLGSVGRAVRRLHDAGYVHPDLQLRNVLVSEGAAPAVTLLDVDTCRRVPGGDSGARERNLRRFYRSWEKWNERQGARLTPSDRAAFEAAYAVAPA